MNFRLLAFLPQLPVRDGKLEGSSEEKRTWREIGQPIPHCRVETKEGFLGEEALGQGLAEGESGGRSSSNFLPPPTRLLPTPRLGLTLGAQAQSHASTFPPMTFLSSTRASPTC